MRRERLRLATPLLILLAAVWVCPARGQPQLESNLPSPRLLTVAPCGGKAGTTVEITLTGNDVEEPQGLLFSHPAIKAELIHEPPPPPDPKKPADKPRRRQAAPTSSVRFKV